MATSIPRNLAKMTVASVASAGLGDVTLDAAVPKFLSFDDAGVADGEIITVLFREGDYLELVQCTYTATGTVLARNTVRVASDAGGVDQNKIALTSAATAEIVTAAEDLNLRLIDYEEFTANDTWTKPAGAKLVFVQVIGGGASGTAGACGSNAAVRSGGGAGGAGGVNQDWFPAAALGSTENVTVGATATGPAGVTHATSANGTAGTIGNTSSFGNMIIAEGGEAPNAASTASVGGDPAYMFVATTTMRTSSGNLYSSTTQPGFGGTGGTSSPATAGARGGIPQFFGGPGGGGGAGGIHTTDAMSAPAAGGAGHDDAGGGAWFNASAATGGGGAAGTSDASTPVAGTAGAAGTAPFFGSGGGGGGSSTTANGAAGGAGGTPGGGGGGGGSTRGSLTSGAGGNGARGAVRVWTYG